MDESKLCIGCLSPKHLLSLDTPVTELDDFGGASDYRRLFFDVFNLELPSHAKTRKICTECVEKLKGAALFKAQVVNSLDIIQESKVFFLETDDAIEESFVNAGIKIEKVSKDEEESLLRLKSVMQINSEITLSKAAMKQKSGKNRAKKEPKRPDDSLYTEEDLTCPECGMRFESPYFLNKHRNTHNPAYVCDECGSGFRYKHSLISHLATHQPVPHQCNICDKIFRSYNSMKHHRLSHTTSKKKKCKICGEELRSYHSQRLHLQEVHGLKLNLFQCTHCEKTFISSTKRTQHIKAIHLKPRPHKCPHCESKFAAPAFLRSHLANAHGIGEKRHGCVYCEKRFTRLFTLREHVRIHTKDFRFSCSLCEKRFIQKCSLKSHIKNHHVVDA